MTLPNTWVTGQTFTAADADNVANAVNAATIAAAAALPASAVVDNADGTISVGSVIGMEPLTPAAAIQTTSATPAIGKITLYNATSGNLTPTLPALSGIAAGRRLAVRRDHADTSTNTVTISTNGADTFYSSGATSLTLPLAGEQREFQVVSVSGTKYWVPAGSLNPLPGLDIRYQGRADLRRASKNTCVIIGDSVAEWGNGGIRYQPQLGYNWFSQLCLESYQRIQYAGNFAKGQTDLVYARDTALPSVLAMSPLPGACIVQSGTNDIAEVTTLNLTFTSGVLKDIVARLLPTGILPILCTIPPRTEVASGGTALLPKTAMWNRWIRRYAKENGFPLIDQYSPVAAADGSYIPAMNFNGDLTHPSAAGSHAIAKRVISDGILEAFPPTTPFLTSRSTSDIVNLLNNGTINEGLHTVDTNSDGVANGYSTTGTAAGGTYTIVAPAATDDLVGNWQQLQRSAGATGTFFAMRTLSGFNAGDIIEFSARIQTENMVATGTQWAINLLHSIPGGWTTPAGTAGGTSANHGLISWLSVDIDDGLMYIKFPVLAGGASTMDLYLQLYGPANSSAIPKIRFGEITVINLTTGGLLV